MILTGHIIRAHVQGKPRASGDDPTVDKFIKDVAA